MTCCSQRLRERITREVDWHEPDRLGLQFQITEPIALVVLRCGRVDFECSRSSSFSMTIAVGSSKLPDPIRPPGNSAALANENSGAAGSGVIHPLQRRARLRVRSSGETRPATDASRPFGGLRGHGGSYCHCRIRDVATKPLSWVTGQSLDRSAEADRRHDLAAAVSHRGADRRNTRLAFLDALGDLVALQNTTGGPAIQGKQRSLRNDPTKAVRGFERDHAAPPVAISDVELNALAGCVAQGCEDRARQVGQWELVFCSTTETDEFETQTEPTVRVASHQTVQLESNRQPVSRRPGQPCLVLEGGEVERISCQSAKNHNPFVNDAHTAYNVH